MSQDSSLNGLELADQFAEVTVLKDGMYLELSEATYRQGFDHQVGWHYEVTKVVRDRFDSHSSEGPNKGLKEKGSRN